MDFDAVINRDNLHITSTTVTESTIYLPEEDASFYKHQSKFYVDVIGKDDGGIRDTRVHIEPDKYTFENITDADKVYLTPKFDWDNALLSNSLSTTTTTDMGAYYGNSVWIGSSNGDFNKMQFNDDVTDVFKRYSADLGSPTGNILFATDTNKIYVSTNDYIYVYSSSKYRENDEQNFVRESACINVNKRLLSFYDEDYICTKAMLSN